MEIDPSIRSRQINYVNRPPQARSTNGPHYHIEYENQNQEFDQSNNQDNQGYHVEQESSSAPTFNVEPIQENCNENQTAEFNGDDLNFCMAKTLFFIIYPLFIDIGANRNYIDPMHVNLERLKKN